MDDKHKIKIDVEPEAKVDTPSIRPETPKENNSSGIFGNINMDVRVKELRNNDTAIKLILSDLIRLNKLDVKSKEIEDNYNLSNQKVAVYEEKMKSVNTKHLLIAVGGISAGYLPSLVGSWGLFALCVIVSLTCLLVGFFKK